MIASMAPGGCASMSRPRAATRRMASSSENTPPRVAETNSPMLWPTITAGSTPQLIHRRASAYWTANVAGCANDARPSSSAAAGSSVAG